MADEYIKRSDTLAKIYYLHIDGEKAIREYDRYKHKDDFTETLQEVVFEIDSIPSADVVEVVRCKDCRHRDPEDHKCDCGQLERAWCVFPVDDDYFCAYGERKGGT